MDVGWWSLRSGRLHPQSLEVEHGPSAALGTIRREFVIVFVKLAESVEADHPVRLPRRRVLHMAPPKMTSRVQKKR